MSNSPLKMRMQILRLWEQLDIHLSTSAKWYLCYYSISVTFSQDTELITVWSGCLLLILLAGWDKRLPSHCWAAKIYFLLVI